MNNYDRMREAARLRFLTYDRDRLLRQPGVEPDAHALRTRFLGQTVSVSLETGEITLTDPESGETRRGNFEEALCIYDWLCDRKASARASGSFCAITDLPGVYVGGSGLTLSGASAAEPADRDPEGFRRACLAMDGEPESLGDLSFRLRAFPDLPVLIKFYFSDGEFPASLTLLWDRHTLDFLRYETVYYLAECLLERIRGQLRPCV